MKKFLALALVAVMLLSACLVGCGKKDPVNTGDSQTTEDTQKTEKTDTTDPVGKPELAAGDIADNMTSADGKYEIAFVTDVGSLKDQSFNQGTWEGVKKYAYDNDKSYKYYQPANGDKATDDDRFNAMKAAADAGAKIIVCAGYLQETALRKAAETFPEVKFVFIDGYQIGFKNVAPMSFQEEQSGYLAGYAAVKEGYTKLGFSGGGGGENPACCRFGYGFAQGANDAAKADGKTVEMNYSWLFGNTFSASSELQTMLNGWYTNGTEVVFCCGGSMCQSAFAAAAANDGVVIGVDVDQSNQSETVVTSAMKGLSESVIFALDKFYAGEFEALGDVSTVLGAANDAVGLPTATWSFENFSVEDYNALLASMKDGKVKVDNDYTKLAADLFANVKLSIVE